MTLPIDYGDWQHEWWAWHNTHRSSLRPTRQHFPGRNFMADEVLGTWDIAGRIVELSAVTFPDLSQPSYRATNNRYVGITYRDPGGEREAGPLCDSWESLEQALGI